MFVYCENGLLFSFLCTYSNSVKLSLFIFSCSTYFESISKVSTDFNQKEQRINEKYKIY